MPLPADFYWTTRSASWPSDALTVIACDGVWVVAMSQRVEDEIWIALLDRHRNGPCGLSRRCTSYEQGTPALNCGWLGMRHGSARTWQQSAAGGRLYA